MLSPVLLDFPSCLLIENAPGLAVNRVFRRLRAACFLSRAIFLSRTMNIGRIAVRFELHVDGFIWKKGQCGQGTFRANAGGVSLGAESTASSSLAVFTPATIGFSGATKLSAITAQAVPAAEIH